MKLNVPIFRLKRQAKLLARETRAPLHKALDQIARREGFQSWSHLSASMVKLRPAATLLSHLQPGDLALLGARPGHGKTLLGLELAAEAALSGRQGFFFTLEYNIEDVLKLLGLLGRDAKAPGASFTVDTSDEICAGHIIAHLEAAPACPVAVIDYLQLLDQKRENPNLNDQMQALKTFARASGAIVVAISQINRAFDRDRRTMPALADVRLPNPVDLGVFTKTCFLHEGEVRLEAQPEAA